MRNYCITNNRSAFAVQKSSVIKSRVFIKYTVVDCACMHYGAVTAIINSVKGCVWMTQSVDKSERVCKILACGMLYNTAMEQDLPNPEVPFPLHCSILPPLSPLFKVHTILAAIHSGRSYMSVIRHKLQEKGKMHFKYLLKQGCGWIMPSTSKFHLEFFIVVYFGFSSPKITQNKQKATKETILSSFNLKQ